MHTSPGILLLLVACSWCVHAVLALSAEEQAQAVLTCLPDSCINHRTTWQHMLDDVPSCIAGSRVWWSEHAAKLPVTLVTQLSVDRIPALKAQCAAWAGPLAAVVYQPLHNPGQAGNVQLSSVNRQKLQTAIALIEELFRSAEADAAKSAASQGGPAASRPGSCQLRVLLAHEVFAEERATTLYPVNALRNYARLLADTPLVANIDVDMLPSASLSKALAEGWDSTSDAAASGSKSGAPGSASSLLSLMSEKEAVVVIPAFETLCGGPAYADELSVAGKQQLSEAIDKECLQPFRNKVAPACHNVTDFARWFGMREEGGGTVKEYAVQYQNEFEPWFISKRAATQWYDVRYRGYGKNKIQQVAHTAGRGAVFHVHPTGFLVHRPHPESAARKTFLRVKFKSRKDASLLSGSLYEHVEALWAQHLPDIRAGSFEPMVDAGLSKCVRELAWWGRREA
mmetsp:Transcript_521/g.1388  ORF Transcript_521/g.1388 Transcript_521/m.1388 type:complete len:455 (-) Transcript_521:411-1775(-)